MTVKNIQINLKNDLSGVIIIITSFTWQVPYGIVPCLIHLNLPLTSVPGTQ